MFKRTACRFYFAAILPLLSLVAWQSPGDPIIVSRGVDLLAATGTIHLDVPANFFASGSSAYSGNLSATGVKKQTAGAYELGTASVVLERRTDLEVDYSPATVAHSVVQVSELVLEGTTPITVVIGGTTQQWTVFASVSDRAVAYGGYDLVRTGASSGTLADSIQVPLVLTFRRSGQVKIQDVGVVTLSTSTGTWTTLAGSASAGLAVERLPLGLALSATLTSTVLDMVVSPAAVDSAKPAPSYVDTTATIDPAVGSLGRYCSIAAGATIGAGAVIGPHATIGSYVNIGDDVIIGDWASVGSGVTVGAGAVISSHAIIASNSSIAADAVVSEAANLGSSCQIEPGAFIGGGSVLGNACVIGDNSKLGARVHMGAASAVADNLQIADNAIIAASTPQASSLVTCYLADGSTEVRALPTSGWSTSWAGVEVQKDSSLPDQSSSISSAPDPDDTEAKDAVDDATLIANLKDAVGNDICPGPYGTGPKWEEGVHECGWFAETLRMKLDLVYDTSFTAVWYLNPCYHWYTPWEPKWINGHAFTDVHWPDGSTTWIAAQLDGEHGVGAPHERLDKNQDGFVEYFDGFHGDDPTDGDAKIEVYGSRAEAEAAGCNVAGN